GNVNNCYTSTPPGPLCPADSDHPGQPVPGGDILKCYETNPPPICPAGSDLAGLPMPQGNPALCDDTVFGDIITRGDADGNAQRPATQGRILPFTGSSILGFVLLGVQLMLAGGLFLRGRNKRSGR
ncbi:MAG: LPXTG cell wall anchor domain-containing protein, partial [Actinomycetota bacterium]